MFQILKQLRFTRCNPISQFLGWMVSPGTKCNPMLSGRRLPIAHLTFLHCVFLNKRMKSDTALLHNRRNPMLSSVPNVKKNFASQLAQPDVVRSAVARLLADSSSWALLHRLTWNMYNKYRSPHTYNKYRCTFMKEMQIQLLVSWLIPLLGRCWRKSQPTLYLIVLWRMSLAGHCIGGKTVRIVKFYYMFSTSSSFTPSLLNIKKVVRCPASVT